MRHIHTSIVSWHVATGGNNKILRTASSHISSSEEILPASFVAPLPKSEQINHSSSNHTYTKSTSNHINHHYAPLCNTHIHNTHHLFNCTHIRNTLSTMDLWTHSAGVTALLARETEKLAGVPQAGNSDSPTSKGQESG